MGRWAQAERAGSTRASLVWFQPTLCDLYKTGSTLELDYEFLGQADSLELVVTRDEGGVVTEVYRDSIDPYGSYLDTGVAPLIGSTYVATLTARQAGSAIGALQSLPFVAV